MTCAHCNQREATVFCDCLIGERKTTWSDTREKIEERLTGGAEVGICDRCLRKLSRKSVASLSTHKTSMIILTIVFAGIAIALVGMAGNWSPLLQYAGIGIFAVSCIIGLLYFYIYIPSVVRKTTYTVFPNVRCGPNGTANYMNGQAYIPVGGGYYESRKEFDVINSYFTEQFRRKVYNEVIVTDEWKKILKAGTIVPAFDSPEALMADCVRRLLDLYSRHPEGFQASRADEVRKIGEELNDAGGMELMLSAHLHFSVENRPMARNLEMVWDGIGSWRG